MSAQPVPQATAATALQPVAVQPAVSIAPVVQPPIRNQPTNAALEGINFKKGFTLILLGIFSLAAFTTFLSFLRLDPEFLQKDYLYGAAIISGVALLAGGGLAIKKGLKDSKSVLYFGAALALLGLASFVLGAHAGMDVAFKSSPLGQDAKEWIAMIFGASVLGMATTCYIAHKANYLRIPGLN